MEKQGIGIGQVPSFGSVQNPVAAMMREHEAEGDRIKAIHQLSAGYTVPPDGCSTYRSTYAMLHDFEQDLYQHIHLENNILFPKAVALEQKQ
jgi:regulator of cell morphogenesis and NO signaling